MTYRELNRRANQLANYLQALGVGPGGLVGIYMERSVEMVVGILGILKGGRAYVPLDPVYPKDRLAFMVKDAQVPVLLTQKRLAERLPEHRADVVFLDAGWEVIAQESPTKPVSGATSKNLAYVLYTSGSTGKPKGVCCGHVGVVNLLTDFENRQPLSVGNACSVWTSLSFDVSVYEIFSALLAGGTLYIAPDRVRADSMAFFEWLSSHQIWSAYIAPFMLKDLADWISRNPDRLSLRRLLVGVEPIPEQLLASISDQVPGLQIINGYGPTEATICATLYDVQSKRARAGNTPIGRPVQNTEIYLLDAHLNPVPIGVAGELHIGGDGLAHEYLNRPELTRERFISNPFSDAPDARLYKTGDLVRYLPDGNIEFLGRNDDQIKIRGFRVELSEIEAVLGRHSAVRETVVLVRDDSPDDKHLVGYVIATPGHTPTVADLRRFLRDKLPDYMVPTAFVFLDVLPVTPNGKVDRNALPAPEGHRPDLEAVYVAPQTELERTIAAVWQEVLHVEKVGLRDNFFDLGGHSLLLVRMNSKLQAVLNKEIPIVDMFKYPTVSALTKYLSPEKSERAVSKQNDDWVAQLDKGKNRLAKLHEHRRRTMEKQ